MIPKTKADAVVRALRAAFNVTAFDDITRLTAGLTSALVFRIVVQGRAYVLRVITRDDVISDPTCQFACMKSAADRGLAPRVWYTSIEDRISITDFVPALPFTPDQARLRLPATLRALHALPPFPKVINYLDFVDRSIERFKAARILPESETSEAFRLYEDVARVYRRQEPRLVSCHNDLKPENILFDGERVWLVDWEAAFLNDLYFDLAVVANFLLKTCAEENDFLEDYFGEAPGEYRTARFYLMRQVVHMSYAMVFMFLGSEGQPIGAAEAAQGFSDFHEAIWSGTLTLVTTKSRLQYGKVHLRQLLINMQTERFEQALRICGQVGLP